MINKQILEKYASLKQQIKLLEEEADSLNPQILEMMQAEEVGEIAIGDLGKLTLASRRTWKYSDYLKEKEEDLKKAKKIEEQTGTASYVEKSYILFKGNKDETNRKEYPLYSGLLKYFPDALAEVSHVSFIGNEQHHPGDPLHWDKSKSTDESDALVRHLLNAGTVDTDGLKHSAKVAWRALALLQREIENENN